MQCPNCKIEMEKGNIPNGLKWTKPLWRYKGWRSLASYGGVEQIDLDAWKCSKCGKVELTTEVEVKP